MINSVIQNWVMELPRREQGTVLTAIRGCDLTPKYPLDSDERQLIGWIRWVIMNPVDNREVGIKGAFFQNTIPEFKPSKFGHYPLHWFTHIMHTLEVIAYRHPEKSIKNKALGGYLDMVNSLHLKPESKLEMIQRLGEDRIVKNNVVS
jgi:hypothetical protein